MRAVDGRAGLRMAIARLLSCWKAFPGGRFLGKSPRVGWSKGFLRKKFVEELGESFWERVGGKLM